MKRNRSSVRGRAMALALASACLPCAALGCGSGEEYSGALPTPDGARFVTDVYPLLLRDCGFVECHGKPERFFHIVGPGRARLDPATEPEDPATFAEVQLTYQRTLSMLASSKELDDSLLLRKPLELAAGGQGHKGVDELARNVFASMADPSYLVLRTWARSNGAPPTAAQVEAVNAAVAAAQEEPSP